MLKGDTLKVGFGDTLEFKIANGTKEDGR